MKVRVKDTGIDGKCVGYYGDIRRYGGDEFELEKDEHFSDIWMEKVEEKKKEEEKEEKKDSKSGSSK